MRSELIICVVMAWITACLVLLVATAAYWLPFPWKVAPIVLFPPAIGSFYLWVSDTLEVIRTSGTANARPPEAAPRAGGNKKE